ncbi:GNAT family N-acetyltransferase [Paenibacillus selenitireducens]|jgi:ribosomal protein S18 acetylase RimI-like enzyme|uniref:GNAT family N-acetyltransferase n=1 Tax=Paenibacillus selenitireducens TaxID=1324314 RepID=A0A1T2X9T4_9BACL|nr:GNAT family N-acetyltransferase [Paenibacillus selenitireducens]OPA76667.1 GNAT family N-acetyltransferase [Paenibacillus selenitireducens]
MIRAAQPQDFEQVVPLIHDAIGSIANTLAGTTDSQEALQVVGEFFQQPGNRLSYENTIVYEIDGQVVGFLLAYHGSQSDALDQPFIERIIAKTGNKDVTLAKEARDDEYYLDSVAVSNTHQGQGIGKKLMRAFEEAGRAKKYAKLSLLVDFENENAHRLYVKMGYHEDGELMVSGYHFRHMIKFC